MPASMVDKYRQALDLIKESKYLKIITHYDGDGTSSAIILTSMAKRMGKKFHLTYVKDLSQNGIRPLLSDDLVIFADAGSDQLRFFPDAENIIVLDHHFYQKSNYKALNINARDFGYDGTRGACGSTMAYIMALIANEENADLFPFFMSGLIADKQDLGGISGLNQVIIDAYGFKYKKERTINLEAQSMLDSITYSTDPFFEGLTGYPDKVKTFLADIEISPDATLNEINEEQKKKLANALSTLLLKQRVGLEALAYIENDIYYFDELGYNSKQLSSIVDGNGKMGQNSVPVAYFLGYQSFKDEMEKNWKMFKTKLIDYVYRAKSELFPGKNVSYFYAPESEMAGAISGILMLYLADQTRPVIGFSVGKEDTKVSSRGTRKQVNRGLNLSIVMREASQAVGGTGGGHDIAAGAVIPKGREMQFLEIADKIVGTQLGQKNETVLN
ncbi:hypothetical protein [Thermoplasma volcanium GSS1]|uniref:Uncharacterized protein n=1 Tax=Thermoplasma volcanium (strain ATCC 51530 / DSM 4299 / JCM 9571 / NBRC 15438 / GSS1) TaxID=273116 RepID=Q979C9_THEVO|nr:hypothetical protein [Thermoplasma volcanium GSS1]